MWTTLAGRPWRSLVGWYLSMVELGTTESRSIMKSMDSRIRLFGNQYAHRHKLAPTV